jgi:hypothetical protein
MSLKYYDFIAERLVTCDLELLDGALQRNFGKSLKDIVRQLEAEAAERTSASPKGDIEFAYDRTPEMTTIFAKAPDSELPRIVAFLSMVKKSEIWRMRLADFTDNFTNNSSICDAVCFRGRSFTERLARKTILGCFSRLGKHRRHTANKREKEAQ